MPPVVNDDATPPTPTLRWPPTMLAAVPTEPAGLGALVVTEVPHPGDPGPGELLIRVSATAVNRADLLQCQGRYPPPPGVTNVLGLEAAGVVAAVGCQTPGWSVGDRVMALLAGGGYAQWVIAPALCALAVPSNMPDTTAAAVPEAMLTAYLELVCLGQLTPGQWVLIHAGASGVGTAAIGIAIALGGRVIATAGSPAKRQLCHDLGAEVTFDARDQPWPAAVAQATANRGVDLVLDLVGAAYWSANVAHLAVGGKLLLVGTLAGRQAAVDLSPLLAKRLTVVGSTLRSRPLAEKAALVRAFAPWGLPRLADGRLRPVIDSYRPLAQAAEAHHHVAANANLGKVVLVVEPSASY